MKKLAIVSALFTACAFSASANAYQAEVGGSYNFSDNDNYSDTHAFGIDGTYYFKPVQTRDAPLNEAAFLDRASNVSAKVDYADNSGVKDSYFGAGAEVFVPGTDFYVSGNIGRDETKVKGYKSDYSNRLTSYGAEVGYLPAPGLLLAVGVKGYDVKDGKDGVDPTVRAKYVTKVGQHNVNMEAYGGFGDLDEYGVRGDFYLDNSLSVGVDYYNNDLSKYDEWGLNAKKFFNQNVSVEGRIGLGDNYNTYGVRAAYRF
ncbi:putative general porin [Acinetobacter calcoaceticus]|uniref:Putative general porin n=1 Tax=Acinetobacter calcoaceticus TaxID=471 RepID=A0A4R1XZL5_ACICA|nr:putative general porin [Acinetobacter calcoaceticus]